MQKQEPIDRLFRRSLTDYRVPPSEERRAAFIREAAGTQKSGQGYFWWILGAVVLILTVVGTAVFVVGNRSKPKPVIVSEVRDSRPLTLAHEVSNSQKQLSPAPVIADNKKPVTTSSGLKTTNQPINPSPALAIKTSPEVPLPGGTSLPNADNPVPVVASTIAAETQIPVNAATSEQLPPVPALSENTQTREQVPGTSADALNGKGYKSDQDTIIIPGRSSRQAGDKRTNSLPKKWNISLDANYTPEWMFNTLNGDKFANNMGVEGTFHFGRYSIRTGAGLSITTGSNEMLVQSNPYLGNYNALDSISFTWDHYVLVPTYYTKSTNVYDTTYNYTYSYNKKRYTYLQIPLVLGYDFWQNEWLSLGIRAGAVMSVLLKSDNLSETYDPGKDRIVTINNITPDRIQMNWQAVGGINAAFRLSRRFSIEVEPQARYYFNSVYESSELTKKPWSIGLRTAFVITF